MDTKDVVLSARRPGFESEGQPPRLSRTRLPAGLSLHSNNNARAVYSDPFDTRQLNGIVTKRKA